MFTYKIYQQITTTIVLAHTLRKIARIQAEARS